MIQGFIAASLDGYIAGPAGDVNFLQAFETVDYGYDAFIASVQTVVMGRATYDQIPTFGVGWPYPGKRGIVVTSSPFTQTYEGVEAWTEGVVTLAAYLRTLPGDSWVVGGAILQATFIEIGELDRLQLFIVPLLLGDGIPLFPNSLKSPRPLKLLSTLPLEKGMVKLDYSLVRNQ